MATTRRPRPQGDVNASVESRNHFGGGGDFVCMTPSPRPRARRPPPNAQCKHFQHNIMPSATRSPPARLWRDTLNPPPDADNRHRRTTTLHCRTATEHWRATKERCRTAKSLCRTATARCCSTKELCRATREHCRTATVRWCSTSEHCRTASERCRTASGRCGAGVERRGAVRLPTRPFRYLGQEFSLASATVSKPLARRAMQWHAENWPWPVPPVRPSLVGWPFQEVRWLRLTVARVSCKLAPHSGVLRLL